MEPLIKDTLNKGHFLMHQPICSGNKFLPPKKDNLSIIDSIPMCLLFRGSTVNIYFQFQFWMEFVPIWEVKGQQLVLIEEWCKLEAYQKELPCHIPKPTPDDGTSLYNIQWNPSIRTPLK